MTKVRSKGAEEARNHLPELLAEAESGRSTVITRHGRPIAILGPIGAGGSSERQHPLTPLEGSGRGLWGDDSRARLRELRDEWDR